MAGEKSIKVVVKKNKEKLKEKEEQVMTSKLELQELTDQLSELNKQHRVNQYRLSQLDRTLKYNLYDPNRSMVESQLNLSHHGAKSVNRYAIVTLLNLCTEGLEVNIVALITRIIPTTILRGVI
jgi:hypothetical protein